MKRHGLLCFERFYEWVEDEHQKKKLITFAPDRDIIWAPVLWDRWTEGTDTIESFAMITTDPPEISLMGHDVSEEATASYLNSALIKRADRS